MNGESSERRSTYVLNIIYNEYGIYLSRRIDPEKEMYQLWQSPGGKVEKDETSKQAVIRETYEETCLLPEETTINHIFNDPEYDCDIYTTNIRDQIPLHAEPKKQGEWKLFSFKEYIDMAQRRETTPSHSNYLMKILESFTLDNNINRLNIEELIIYHKMFLENIEKTKRASLEKLPTPRKVLVTIINNYWKTRSSYNIKWYNYKIQEELPDFYFREQRENYFKRTKIYIIRNFGTLVEKKDISKGERQEKYYLSQHIVHKYLKEKDNYYPLCLECISGTDAVIQEREDREKRRQNKQLYEQKEREIKQEFYERKEEITRKFNRRMNELKEEFQDKI